MNTTELSGLIQRQTELRGGGAKQKDDEQKEEKQPSEPINPLGPTTGPTDPHSGNASSQNRHDQVHDYVINKIVPDVSRK